MIAKAYKWTKAELQWLSDHGIKDDTYIGQPIKLPTRKRRIQPAKRK